jgi:hypothetical protein
MSVFETLASSSILVTTSLGVGTKITSGLRAVGCASTFGEGWDSAARAGKPVKQVKPAASVHKKKHKLFGLHIASSP